MNKALASPAPPFTFRGLPGLFQYGAALFSTFLATLLRWVLDPVLAGAEAFDLYYLAVALTAWRWGWKPAALTLFSSLVAALYFFVPPRYGFGIYTTAQAVPLLAFLAVGGSLLYLSERLHYALRCAKQNAAELRHQKEEYQNSFDLSVVGQAQVDPSTARFIRVNASFCGITGYSRDELLQMTFVEITHPEDKDRDFEALKKLRSGEIPSYTSEKRYIRKDGQVVWIKVDVTMLRDAQGAPLRTIGIFEDITERKRAEAELRKSQSLLAALAENSPAPIFIKDTEGRHLLMNHRYELVFHQGREELRGKTDFDLFPARLPNVTGGTIWKSAKPANHSPSRKPFRCRMAFTITPGLNFRCSMIKATFMPSEAWLWISRLASKRKRR